MTTAETMEYRPRVTADLNFTGRRRIPREHVKFELKTAPRPATLIPQRVEPAAKFPDLDPDSRLIIEIRGRTTYERIPWGTVGAPRRDAMRLCSDPAHARRFRLMVIPPEGDDSGRILAECPSIFLKRDDEVRLGKSSLLPLRVTKTLKDRLWKVAWLEDEGRPELQLNGHLSWLKGRFLEDPLLQVAILPAALEKILRSLVRDEDDGEDGWKEEWREQWKKWTKEMGQGEVPRSGSATEKEEWIEGVIDAFCRRNGWISLLGSSRGGPN